MLSRHENEIQADPLKIQNHRLPAEALQRFVSKHNIKILNVAGDLSPTKIAGDSILLAGIYTCDYLSS